jgi:hypothetical protein
MITTKRIYSIDRLYIRGWIYGNFFRDVKIKGRYNIIKYHYKQLNELNDDNN